MGKLATILLLFQILNASISQAGLPVQITGPSAVSGKEVSVKAGGRGLVVTFLSAKCPCSDSHVAVLKDLSAKFKEFSFVAIHSNFDEAADLTKAYEASRTTVRSLMKAVDYQPQ